MFLILIFSSLLHPLCGNKGWTEKTTRQSKNFRVKVVGKNKNGLLPDFLYLTYNKKGAQKREGGRDKMVVPNKMKSIKQN